MGSSLLETFTSDEIKRHIKLVQDAAQQQLRAEAMQVGAWRPSVSALFGA